MNLDMLEKLVKLMSTNDLNTVDLRDGEQRVVLKRGVPVAASSPGGQWHSAPAPQPVAAPAAAPSASPSAPVDDEGLVAIKSPMVGTFYARPSPDAKNFVQVGTVVNEESDVCIIEAMKVFNNIKAEVRGTVTRIVAEDGKPVEFGQVLFLVKP
ncbi:MAG: acetyl-CoA carboxylase biotin carboxyl carrier protein [Burkholderiales bacterium]|nr:acetyl-CoA carboxylase biotin carboxyl carrier protein [Phycisphaerae bacterium]